MSFRAFLLAGLIATAAVPVVLAQTAPEAATPAEEAAVRQLSDTMQIGPLFEVLAEEGQAHGRTLEEEMFPGGGPSWDDTVARIYDTARLKPAFDTALVAELAGQPGLAEMQAFFGSDLGQRILTLEIDARRALLDTAVEEAAQVAADGMRAGRDPRVALVERLAEAGDLVEMNVAGSMTGNLAFMKGMAEQGIYGQDMTEDQMMSDLWNQETQIRDETTTWLYSYLLFSYEPLTDAELETYIDFYASDAGKRLNAALFVAFDKVFRQVSYDLGRAAGRAMLGSDI